ncbi:hypothetical protein PRZ48_007805 [Zasmidium cellare]|uniref:Homeobox domain-containing protein n=1 Tax=Zasmidium cellare TaxID=395010 RepID=A0ABR0EKA1_ZASCE|nr:hypothetical protein PRZ48_007805 [Zasmidium cellare]
MALSSSNELPTHTFQDDFQYSGHSDPLTDFSGESGLFSILDTGGSSNTVDSYLDVGNMPFNEDSLHQDPVMISNLPNWPIQENQNTPIEQWYNGTQDVEMLDNAQINLTASQLETLNFWLQRCTREHRHPTEPEVQAIATLANLSIDAVLSWFHARQAPPPVNTATADVAPGMHVRMLSRGKLALTNATNAQLAVASQRTTSTPGNDI